MACSPVAGIDRWLFSVGAEAGGASRVNQAYHYRSHRQVDEGISVLFPLILSNA
jgi:hypothetical protein